MITQEVIESNITFLEAEELLTHKGILLDKVMASMGDGLSIQDMDMRIVYQNKFMIDHFGDHKGECCYAVYEKRSEVCEGCPIRMAYQDGQVHKALRVGITHDGTPFRFENIASVLRNKQGDIVAGMELCRIVEDREKLRDNLEKSEKRFRDIAINMADWIWETDENGVYTYCSEKVKTILGYEPKELIGKTPFDLMPSDEAQNNICCFSKFAKDKKALQDWESWNLTKDGNRVCLLRSGVPIINECGELIGYRGIDKNITERKKAEAEKEHLQSQLSQMSKMSAIGTLAGGIAHDFNNLLFVIQGNIELLMAELADPTSELYVLSENILKSTQRGAELAKQLLSFARRESCSLKPTDINQVLREMTAVLERSIEKMISIETHCQSRPSIILADASQIHHAILNICLNAKDAMPKGGKLTIAVHDVLIDEEFVNTHAEARPGKFVRISISDTGIGMSKEVMARIFEPFFTTKEIGKGTGLGLSVTYGIIKGNRGFITVYSEPNQGSCFQIYLPASEEKPDTKPATLEACENGNGTILLVDDEPMIRALAKRMLEKNGYQVLLAQDGEEALALYQKNQAEIKLVLLDYIMPGRSGKEVLEELIKINPDVKVIFSSGYSLNIQGLDLIRMGAKDFIQKPFSTADLLKTIKIIE